MVAESKCIEKLKVHQKKTCSHPITNLSADEDVNESNYIRIKPTSNQKQAAIKCWNINKVNQGALLRNLKRISGVNWCMFSIRGASKIFSIHMKNKNCFSILFLFHMVAKIWNVIDSTSQFRFETQSPSKLWTENISSSTTKDRNKS